MDWSRTKTIFIFTFLLLNLFLGYQLYEKIEGADLSLLVNPDLQERLEENRIEIEIDEPDETPEAGPITGTLITFDEDELVENLDRQDPVLLNDHTVYSEMENPYRLVDANLSASVEAFLQTYVMNGDEYQIAYYDEEEGFIGLYQTFQGRLIDQYERENFHLVLYISEDFGVEAYRQRYMSITEQEDRTQEVLSPMEAVEQLFDHGNIRQNAVVHSAFLGYYSLIQPDDTFQVFAPVWRINVDNDFYYVDAINGEIQSIS